MSINYYIWKLYRSKKFTMKRKFKFYAAILFSFVMLFSFESCNKSQFSNNRNVSSATGWAINNKKGGFQYNTNYKGQEAPPNMVLVEGGTYTKGRVQDDPIDDWNNTANQQHVQSFYMDQTEVTNIMYLEYLDWLKRNEKDDPDIYLGALPDTLVWRNKLGYAEEMVNSYLRHPAFSDYPVVGVSWIQAYEYAEWRTDRYQELILEKNGWLAKGTMETDNGQIIRSSGEEQLIKNGNFSQDPYVQAPNKTFGGDIENTSTLMEGSTARKEANRKASNLGIDNSEEQGPPSSANRETGLITPKFRLPTESEWEYAALGLIETRQFNVYQARKKYPWQGQYTRTGQRRNIGDQLANFKNSDGDYGGIAGWSDDGADITNKVRSYDPNAFGLYDMAGNVAEWVADVYRPIIDDEFNDFNYFRGNDYKKFKIDSGNNNQVVLAQKTQWDTLSNGKRVAVVRKGEILTMDLEDQDLKNRTQFDKSYNVDYRDGDVRSTRAYNEQGETQTMYKSPDLDVISDNGETTLISDQVRVYKGGSWKDRAYWLDPAQRRFYHQDQATDFIGFRCVMSRLGGKSLDMKKRSRN